MAVRTRSGGFAQKVGVDSACERPLPPSAVVPLIRGQSGSSLPTIHYFFTAK
jgi:hypothetical protein